MARRRAARWDTRFGRWVERYGVRELTQQLASRNLPTTENAVYGWLAGDRVPRLERAVALQEISRGAVRVQDICRHREQVRSGTT